MLHDKNLSSPLPDFSWTYLAVLCLSSVAIDVLTPTCTQNSVCFHVWPQQRNIKSHTYTHYAPTTLLPCPETWAKGLKGPIGQPIFRQCTLENIETSNHYFNSLMIHVFDIQTDFSVGVDTVQPVKSFGGPCTMARLFFILAKGRYFHSPTF